MLGIMGGGAGPDCAAAFDSMVKAAMHEGFYTSDTYCDPRLDLRIGWICQKGFYSDCLPIWNENKDILLVICGELFPNQALLAELKSNGHHFDHDGPGYVVHLYEELGPKCFERLNGVFSGMVMDLRERKAVLFNDRYGLKRTYHHQNDDGFYFASEAKSLLKVLPQLRRLDLQGLGEFFSCGCVLQNRTMFSGVSILPGAACWTFSADGGFRKESYFEPEVWGKQSPLSSPEYAARLSETFRSVLPPYLNGTQRVGMSMTGGIDSRLILAWEKGSANRLPCYTFGGPYRECADVRIARKLAKVCGLSHQTIHVGEEFLREFPALAEKTIYLSDGTMDVSGAVELYVNRLARKIAPVRLTGNYGSEILRSHVAFRPGRLDETLFEPEFARYLQQAEATYASERQCRPLAFIAFKQVPWHHYARSSIEQSQLTVRSPYMDNELVKLAFQAPPEMAMDAAHLLRLISEGNPLLGRIPTDRGITYSADRMMNRVHRSVQEFLAKAEYAYDYGMPNWLARADRYLAPLHLEKLFLGRQKFCHFRSWYRHELAGYVKEILLDPRSRSRSYVNGAALERAVNSHADGLRNYTVEIHKLLSIELLHRTLLDRSDT
jgi:asparagine synthase (glutamine-hydrolysing)